MTPFNKTQVFTEDINPLMEEVRRICHQHSIPYVAAFQTESAANDEVIIGMDNCRPGDQPSVRLALMTALNRVSEPELDAMVQKLGYGTVKRKAKK